MHHDHLRVLLKPILRISGLVDPRVEFSDAVETSLQEHCLGESEKNLYVDPRTKRKKLPKTCRQSNITVSTCWAG